MVEHDDKSTSIYLTLQISSVSTLSKLFTKLEGVRGVLKVERMRQ